MLHLIEKIGKSEALAIESCDTSVFIKLDSSITLKAWWGWARQGFNNLNEGYEGMKYDGLDKNSMGKI